jgi:hypothetical protein
MTPLRRAAEAELYFASRDPSLADRVLGKRRSRPADKRESIDWSDCPLAKAFPRLWFGEDAAMLD